MAKDTKKGGKGSGAKEGVSTRQMILDQANEMINAIGVVDFRIDKLASSLGLSPGNITYHFPKKEDISNALWEQCLADCTSSSEYYMTSLLDIKQLYLLYRTIAISMLKYKGVLCYKMGDIGVINRGEKKIAELQTSSRKMHDEQMSTLQNNGYCQVPSAEGIQNLTYSVRLLSTYWWINHSIMRHPEGESDELIDHYAFLMIYPLKPFLTEKGLNQFNDILDSVKR